ncbi:MAG: Lytic transglycosylase catalytic [Enterovirga sp.]|nr:Lytic transglycosylase catalytic [Enterovirga sp.]
MTHMPLRHPIPPRPCGQTTALVAAAAIAWAVLGAPASGQEKGPAAGPLTTGSIPPASSAQAAPLAAAPPGAVSPGGQQAGAGQALPDTAAAVLLPDGQAPDVLAVRDAIAAYRKGEIEIGDRIRSRVSASATPLLDWAAIRYGGSAIDFDRLAAFLRDYPDWPGAGWARRRAEEALVSERKGADVVRAFFARERPQSASGKLALAQVFKADGLPQDAAALIRTAWRNDLFGRELEARMVSEFPNDLTEADHRFRMERLLFKENWEAAKRAADYAGKGYDALVKARAAVVGKATNAGKLLDAVPANLRADTSFLYSRVMFLRRAEKTEEAAKLFAGLTRDPEVLVDGDEWWVERRLVARKLLDGGDPKGAYGIVVDQAAEASEKRIEAEFHAGWIALWFTKEPAVAARHFDRVAQIAQTPISLARAAYWQGRAAEAAGAAAEAREFYEKAARQGITYYGQLAAGKLGSGQLTIRSRPDPASPERIAAAGAPITQAIGLLYAAGLRDLAVPLMVELAKKGTNVAEVDAAGELALAYRDAKGLLVLGKAATQRGLPLDEHAFPTIGIPAFETVGDRVDPAMVHAIARQESAFDPSAQSTAGARGLMQLMPATAQATARKFGVAFDLSRLVDGAYNARLGSAHLGELMDSWRGSYILTFASYNAGPGNVRKWIEAYGDPRKPDVDPIDWVERIPFSETRNYVQRVMENMQVYRRRLGERSALLMESDLKRGLVAP